MFKHQSNGGKKKERGEKEGEREEEKIELSLRTV